MWLRPLTSTRKSTSNLFRRHETRSCHFTLLQKKKSTGVTPPFIFLLLSFFTSCPTFLKRNGHPKGSCTSIHSSTTSVSFEMVCFRLTLPSCFCFTSFLSHYVFYLSARRFDLISFFSSFPGVRASPSRAAYWTGLSFKDHR